jgi:iron complex outermembrane receptor protein
MEIDAFNVERAIVRKGPASLLYGSDAMGGVIEIAQLPPPDSRLFGEVVMLGQSVNAASGASLMLGVKEDAWYTKLRYSEKHFGDYRIPSDTIVYLTQRLPVYQRKLKNTAGRERDASLYSEYRRGYYQASFAVSDVYQQTGFFPGAHGVPAIARLQDDGNSRNIDLPYSSVNHLKISTHQQYTWDGMTGYCDLGYQRNQREEWSAFHTHYGTDQAVPVKDPDKELDFGLDTYSASVKLKSVSSARWEHTAGWDVQYQRNRIGGYSFLLPEYDRFATGLLWLTTYRPSNTLFVSGGIRYDYGQINISACADDYLYRYLIKNSYPEETAEAYSRRSYAVNRRFGDFSASLGTVWTPGKEHLIKWNIGRSFRLPGANELASNGVHHGTFRHEQGDPALSSERGWQMDVSYGYEGENLTFSVSPFVARFDNYIYLRPSGKWSVLPHAGQIYRYTGIQAEFSGVEISFDGDFLQHFNYHFAGEYTYTYNVDEHTPLSYSPPASMRNRLTWKIKNITIHAEWQRIATQNRVAKNEDATPGANLLHAGTALRIPIGGIRTTVSLSLRNLLDTRYYNHLSFYRKVEIPEPGRSFRLFIQIPINIP